MFDDDPRWGSDPPEREDAARDRDLVDPRDAFVDQLNLPRGPERELDRPKNYSQSDGARFELSYEKTRGIAGGDALKPFIAALTADGWVCEGAEGDDSFRRARRKLLELVRQASEDGEPIQTKTEAAKSARVQRQVATSAWDSLVDDGAIEWRDDPEGFHAVE